MLGKKSGKSFRLLQTKRKIIHNYPPKGRWIVVDIYGDAKRGGVYPPLFTHPEGDSCFSIYQIRWIANQNARKLLSTDLVNTKYNQEPMVSMIGSWYNYIRNSFAAIFHSIWRENIKLGSRTCPVHSTPGRSGRSNGNSATPESPAHYILNWPLPAKAFQGQWNKQLKCWIDRRKSTGLGMKNSFRENGKQIIEF